MLLHQVLKSLGLGNIKLQLKLYPMNIFFYNWQELQILKYYQ